MPGYSDKGQDRFGHQVMHGSPWGPARDGSYNVDTDAEGKRSHGTTSHAWNPDFEKEAIAFEQKLGVQAFNHPAANGAAGQACAKAIQYMDKRGSISGKLGDLGKSMDELMKACGGDSTWIAGDIGKDVDTVRAAMEGGNIRERMTAWHHFIDHVFKADMRAPEETFAELEQIMAETGVQLEHMKEWRENTPGALDPNNSGAVYSSPIYADESGKEPAEGMVDQLGQLRSNSQDVLKQTGQENRAYAQTSQTASSLASIEVKNAQGEMVNAGLSKAELDQQGVGPNEALGWSEGMKARIMDEMHPWTQLMREISVPLRAGPSGHTNVFMKGNELLGVGADPDAMRLACLGYLLPINAHSMVEVLQAAKPYGTSPYREGREMYADVAPLSEAELRACGMPDESYPAGRLPHEMPGAADNPNQQGRESMLERGGSSSMAS